jgi:hypothetical protein
MGTAELEAEKKGLLAAIRTQQHAKETYEHTAAQLSQIINDFRPLELEDVLRSKEILKLKDRLQREKAEKLLQLERIEQLEKQLQAQEEEILSLELSLTSMKLGENARKEGENARSYGSTAATTMQASSWRLQDKPENELKLREMEERVMNLERESEEQCEITLQLQQCLSQLVPRRPRPRSAPSFQKCKRHKGGNKGAKWVRRCPGCANKLNCS